MCSKQPISSAANFLIYFVKKEMSQYKHQKKKKKKRIQAECFTNENKTLWEKKKSEYVKYNNWC